MPGQRTVASTLALTAVGVLSLSGCMSYKPLSIETAATPRVLPGPDCGTAAILETAPGLGAYSRRDLIYSALNGHRALIESSPSANTLGYAPEDAVLVFEEALKALPAVEDGAASDQTVSVPAVTGTGTYLGELVIRSDQGTYVFDTVLIAHEGGVPCSRG